MNSVFIACSLDGFIADKNGSVAWLDTIEYPKDDDMGYGEFMSRVDALIMGRKTFETVCGFDVEWPYTKPVFVLSNSLASVPDAYKGKAFLVKGPLKEILADLRSKGLKNLYIDGGNTIQSFLEEDLIDEMIITTIPVLLGDGISLFGKRNESLIFEISNSQTYGRTISQVTYLRKPGRVGE